MIDQAAFVVGNGLGGPIGHPHLFRFHLQRSDCGFRFLGRFFVRRNGLFGVGDPLLEFRQGLFGRVLLRDGLGYLLLGGVGLILRFLLLELCRGQSALGCIACRALGGGLRSGLLAFLIEPNELLGRLLCRLICGRRGGQPILSGGHSLFGRLLLRLRFGQVLRGGCVQSLRMLLVLLRFGQASFGVVGHFAFGGRIVGSLFLFCLWFGGILANLFGPGLGLLGRGFGCLVSAGGDSNLGLDVRENLTCEFLVGRCFSQRSYDGVRPILGLLVVLLCLGQSGRGINGCFASRGGLGCRQLLALRRLGDILSHLLGCRQSRGGGGHFVLGAGQGIVGRFLLRCAFRQFLHGNRGLILRRFLLLLRFGQGRLGLVGRFAFGGRIVDGLFLFCLRFCGILRNLFGRGRGVPSRLLGCRRCSGGSGHLVLGVGQGSVGPFIHLRRISHRFCGGVGLCLRLLLTLLCLG